MVISRMIALGAMGVLFVACSGGPSGTTIPADSTGGTQPVIVGAVPLPYDLTSPYGIAVLADSPIAYYPLDESGSMVVDRSGRGFNGGVVNSSGVTRQTASLLSGNSTDSTTFAGNVAGAIVVERNAAFESPRAISIEAWTRLGARGPRALQTIAGYGDHGYTLGYDVVRDAFFFTAAFPWGAVVLEPTSGAGAAPPLESVFHLVGTYDGSHAELYVNGALAAEQPVSAGLQYDPSNVASGLIIGNNVQRTAPAIAAVQAVAIYAKALSAAEIAKHFAIGSPSATPQPGGLGAPAPTSMPAATPSPQPSATTVSSILVPSAGAIYLGARVDPSGGTYNQADVHTLESQIGRTLALDDQYHGWGTAWPGPSEADDLANHRVPVVAWNCGASDYDVAMAGSGGPNAAAINAQIDATASAVKTYGAPIMIRWFWEMNLSSANVDRAACWDAAHDETVGGVEFFDPHWYAAAFEYIVARFRGDGAANAIWVWCPSAGGQDPAAYYPGDASVDWLAFDNYALSNNQSLSSTLAVPYGALTAINSSKPILVAETATLPANQPGWLSNANVTLQTVYPNIKGFMYFDASGPRANWSLSNAGLGAFTLLAHTQYLSAP